MMNYHRVDVAGYDRPVLIKTAYLASEDTTKVATTRYLPGQDAIATSFGQDVVNTYVAPMHKATSERPDVFLDHRKLHWSKPVTPWIDFVGQILRHEKRHKSKSA